jgi:catechol 2,3-dioxygenase-like lactoylglutathione lyase family enzyme
MATRKPSRAARSAKRPARKPTPSRPARKATAARKTAARKTKPARPARRPAPPARMAAAPPRPSLVGGIDKRRHDPQTLRLRAFEPSLTVNDVQKSIDFYTKILGFIQGERWEDGGVLKGVMLKAGACTIGLSQDDWSKGRDRVKGTGVRLWCETVQDINALAERIRRAGGVLTEEPTDNAEMKMQTMAIDDLDGYHVAIFRKTS